MYWNICLSAAISNTKDEPTRVRFFGKVMILRWLGEERWWKKKNVMESNRAAATACYLFISKHSRYNQEQILLKSHLLRDWYEARSASKISTRARTIISTFGNKRGGGSPNSERLEQSQWQGIKLQSWAIGPYWTEEMIPRTQRGRRLR